jgi:surface carbohydrate biosynthesis protein
VKIALIVDNPYRDLPGLVLVALHLCQQDCTCFLVPAGLKDREIWTLVPDFVLLHNFRTDKEASARRMLRVGMRLGVLDTEGGVFRGFEQYAETLARDASLRHGVSCFCSWGPRLAGHALEQGWFRDSQVTVTGAPRLDFYAPPWREASLNMPWLADAPPEPVVLINGNFSLANPLFRTPREAAAYKISRWGYEEQTVLRSLEAERAAMLEMVALANRLAAALPDVTFVYRPHPFENPETYRELLDQRRNLHVVKRGTVDGWILRSRAVIQRGCSTAIEAAAAGVPAFSPGWIRAPVDFPAVDAVSLFSSTLDELTDGVRQAVNGGVSLPERLQHNLRQVLADWFFAVDGNAGERVAAAILRAAGSQTGAVSPARCLDALDGLMEPAVPWTVRARAIARRSLRRSIHWSFRRWRDVVDLSWDRDQRFFDAAAVRSLVDVIQPVAQAARGAWRPVAVSSALERGGYHFAYAHGRSVALSPE